MEHNDLPHITGVENCNTNLIGQGDLSTFSWGHAVVFLEGSIPYITIVILLRLL